jgi:hypothetical protein
VKAQFLDHVELAHLHQRHHAGGPPESLRACAPALDELGLAGALVQVTQRLTAGTPLAVDLAVGELSSLPAAMEVAAFRIVTEAVTNAVRHAAASTCRSPSRSPAGCRWSVSDDGRGFDIERAASTSCSWTSTCPHCRASRRPLGSPPCPTRPRCWSSRWSPTTTPSWAAMRRRPRLCPQGRDRRPDRRGGPHARRRRRGLRRRRRTRARADLHGGPRPHPGPVDGLTDPERQVLALLAEGSSNGTDRPRAGPVGQDGPELRLSHPRQVAGRRPNPGRPPSLQEKGS